MPTASLDKSELFIRRMFASEPSYELIKKDSLNGHMRLTYYNSTLGVYDRIFIKDDICVLYCQVFKEKALNEVISVLDKQYEKSGDKDWIDTLFHHEVKLILKDESFLVYYRNLAKLQSHS